jgi:serine/threonine protein kinase
MPFGAEFFDEDQVGECFIHQPLAFKESDRSSDSAKALIHGMLEKDPRNRLSHGDVNAHPFFATM